MSDSVDIAAKAMASLYVWETVVAILEGSPTPDVGSEDAQKVIEIAKKNQKKCLRKYDDFAAKARGESQ